MEYRIETSGIISTIFSDISTSQEDDNLDEQQRLAKFFLQKKLSPEAADNPQVKELLKMLKSPSQFSNDIIGKKCLELFKEEKVKMKQTLSNLDGKISLSVDILRAGKQYKHGSEYLCLTAVFIDENWELKRWVLKFGLIGHRLDDSPSAIILEALKDWGIERKINTITILNHALSDETIANVKDHICGKTKLPLDGKLFGVRCSGDLVKLMVQEAYDAISEIVESIGEFYSFKDGKHTWDNRCSQLKEALIMQSAGHYSSRYMPSKEKWNRVSSVCDLVFDVYDVVFSLFEMGYLTSNIFLHHLQELQSLLIQRHKDTIGIITSVIPKMLERLDKYMKEMYLVLAMSSVMDPRFKMNYIEFSSSKFKGDQSNSQVDMVSKSIHSLYEEYAVHCPAKDGYLGQDLLTEYSQFLKSKDQPPKSELDCYLEEPVIAWTKDLNILSWWKAGSVKYPILSRMARDLLAIPVTVSISDDAFYMKQRKADYSVIASEPELMNAFVCIRNWFLDN